MVINMNRIVLEIKIIINKFRHRFNSDIGRTKVDDDGYVQ